MTIVCTEGHRFDTEKAKRHWDLGYYNGSNLHTGDLYLSSKGTWYCWTPSQYGNGHRWEVNDAAVLVEQYGYGLASDEKREIIELAGLETE